MASNSSGPPETASVSYGFNGERCLAFSGGSTNELESVNMATVSGEGHMNEVRRRRLFVDFKFQGAMLLRTVLYWVYCLIAVSVITIGWIVFTEMPTSSADLFHGLGRKFGPALIGAMLLLPIVLLDCLRLSHRFAGPMLRVRRALKQLGDGETPEKIKLRDGDFWTDFADEVNRIIDRRTNQVESDRPAPCSVGEPVCNDPPASTAANIGNGSIYSDMSA